ncbi:MAG: polyketide cyclase [Saprospiraceae bacterium]|nr:polyketide cyclase [Saprospiraceae bacterium]
MEPLTLNNPPAVNVQMLIRVPARDAFQAFIDPDITSNFWFSRSDGPLKVGIPNRFYFDMYNISGPVNVMSIEEDKRIQIEWGDAPHDSRVEWTFEDRGDNTTLVKICNNGFSGDGDSQMAIAIDSMGGFAMLLAGAKAWLEHNIELKLTSDSFPDGHP